MRVELNEEIKIMISDNQVVCSPTRFFSTPGGTVRWISDHPFMVLFDLDSPLNQVDGSALPVRGSEREMYVFEDRVIASANPGGFKYSLIVFLQEEKRFVTLDPELIVRTEILPK